MTVGDDALVCADGSQRGSPPGRISRHWRGIISPSSPEKPLARALALAILLGFGVIAMSPSSVAMPVTIAIAALTALGVAAGSPLAFHTGVITLLSQLYRLPLLGAWWPAPNVLALLVYGAIVYFARPRWRFSNWCRRGILDRRSRLLIVLFSVGPGIALVGWRYASGDDMMRFRAFVPAVPMWAIALGVPLYAMLNALYEELIFRGIFQQSLAAALQRPRVAMVLQAILFGAAHYAQGFPRGLVGAALAGSYGLMTGYLRHRTKGMLAGWLTHVAADTVIFVLVAIFVLKLR